jgi:hypothetical protein
MNCENAVISVGRCFFTSKNGFARQICCIATLRCSVVNPKELAIKDISNGRRLYIHVRYYSGCIEIDLFLSSFHFSLNYLNINHVINYQFAL